MENSLEEKYLGDLVNSTGTIRKTVEERKNKGYGIVSEIVDILDEIPLGRYKHEIGLKLRQAMLLNGILYNSEVWHSVTETELRMLEVVDEHLLRSLVKGQSKTPLEFLYLEAGAIPIRYLIACRRLLYHQTILQRDESELTNKVYLAQKDDPTPGDFADLVSKDFALIGEAHDDNSIQGANRSEYKAKIKSSIKQAALSYLKDKQQQHSKVRHIQYDKLQTQEYMTSAIFTNEDVQLLHALRSRSTDCKANYKQKYIHSNIKCDLCKNEDETQQHILECKEIRKEYKSVDVAKDKGNYENLFCKDVKKQKEITTLFKHLFNERERLIQKQNSQQAPSNTTVMLKLSDNLQICTVHSSLGK